VVGTARRRGRRIRPVLRDGAGVGCRLVLAGVWLYAGGSKLTDLDGSVRAVKAYDLLPPALAEWVGAALPFVEVGLGLLLLVGLATRVAAAGSVLLIAAFVVGIASAWARGLEIDCGCFGSGGELAAGESPTYLADLLRDLALLAMAGLLWWRPVTRWSADRWLAGERPDAPPSAA